MGLIIDAPQPDEPTSGASVQRGSLAARKTQFVNDSTVGTISVTIAAGGIHTITFNLGVWSPDLPTVARNEKNIVNTSSIIAWSSVDIYIDNDLNTNFYIGSGASLSADQGKVTGMFVRQRAVIAYSGSVGYSASHQYRIQNNGASPHTIYFYGSFKFINYGEAIL